jgi:hypothetical protein
MIPANPAKIEKMLTIPPRVPGNNASNTPIKPAQIAMAANSSPKKPPLAKLNRAQMSATIEKKLKPALCFV